MKTLITGGAGFIGSHLAERLLEQGDEVFIVDNLWTGSLNNIKKIQNHERLHLVVDTILNESVMNELIFKIDRIYHLAAAVGVRNVMDHPVETLEVNVKGSEVILRLANQFKKKIFIASTSEVYGKHVEHDLSEDDNRVMGSVQRGDGPMPAQRPWTNFWHWPTSTKKNCRYSSAGFSIRSAPAKPDNTGWSCPILSSVHFWENRSPYMEMGPRPGVSSMSTISWMPSPP